MKIRNVPISWIVAAAGVAASTWLSLEWAYTRDELEQANVGRLADAQRIRDLDSELRRARSMAYTPVQAPGAAPPGATPPPKNNQQVANSAGPEFGMPPGPRGMPPGNYNNSPADQNSRRLQQEIRLRRMYADMPATLNLDAATTDKLFDLLADSQVASWNDARNYQGDPAGRQAVEAAAREQRDAAIESLLGPDKAAEFQSFEKSIPARMQVNRIGESMAAANVPLTDAQRTSLIAAVAIEQQAVPMPPRFSADGSGGPDYDTAFLDWQADYSRRVQARIEPLLSAEQLRQYREAVEIQNNRRATQRARVENRRNAPAQP